VLPRPPLQTIQPEPRSVLSPFPSLSSQLTQNSDNVTPPVASALGDLMTLSILSLISTIYLPFLHTFLPLFLILLLFAVAVIAALKVRQNTHVRSLLKRGWTPLFGAMLITSGSGLVLDSYVEKFRGFGLLATVITGLSLLLFSDSGSLL
jgi:solute carrier family 41